MTNESSTEPTESTSVPKIHYMHLPVGGSRVTLAILNSEDKRAVVGMAFCSPKDQFCRRKGRRMAAQRLVGAWNVVFVPFHMENPAFAVTALKKQVAAFMYNYFAEKHNGVPSWVRKCVRDRNSHAAGIQSTGVFSSNELACEVNVDDRTGTVFLSREFVQALLEEFPEQNDD